MLKRRVIVCLDVRNRKVTKGVRFQGNIDLGDPVEMAHKYYLDGVDELVFYDITASSENRPIDIEMVREVAKKVFIPFAVGGGIRNLDDMHQVLLAGAEKVSINSLAVLNPQIIAHGARAFGNQCMVLGLDAKRVGISDQTPSGYEVVIHGGRKPMGLDVVEWAKKAVDLGIGEICLNAIDTDGVRQGYEIEITRKVANAVSVPVIASGGAGETSHLVDVFEQAGADAALIASMVHTETHTIPQIKNELHRRGIPVRRSF